MATEKNYNLLMTIKNINPVCSICNTRYDLSNIKIIDETRNGVLSFFSCSSCGSSFITSVSETPFGHVAKGMLVELEENEVLDYMKKEGIVTQDDVLNLYELFKKDKKILKRILN